jgi:hypothetical protein
MVSEIQPKVRVYSLGCGSKFIAVIISCPAVNVSSGNVGEIQLISDKYVYLP